MFVAYVPALGYVRGKSYTFKRGTEETWTPDLQQARVFKTEHNARMAAGKDILCTPIEIKLKIVKKPAPKAKN